MAVETGKTIALYGVSGRAYSFDNAVYLSSWEPPYRAGLYAIFVVSSQGRYDSRKPIYIGESGNLSERGFETHHKLDCWKRMANGNNLAVAICLMPYSTSAERRDVEGDLIVNYTPVCNN